MCFLEGLKKLERAPNKIVKVLDFVVVVCFSNKYDPKKQKWRISINEDFVW